MGIHVRWPFETSDRRATRLQGKNLSCSPFGPLGDRFHFWIGASRRRYVCTIFSAGDTALEGLDLSCAVVIAVARGADGDCRALSIVPHGLPLRLHASAGNWLGGRTPNEFHVHLLPSNREQRDAAYADLQRAFILRQ
ncbi:MAG: hypothetical protein JOZ16_17500 [Methylobacteriaceae bacterium]|nr:hypothetical protein [Methylobacteriaceae bacterium]